MAILHGCICNIVAAGCGGIAVAVAAALIIAQLVNVNHVGGLCVDHQIPRIDERILANGAQQFGARRRSLCRRKGETCEN